MSDAVMSVAFPAVMAVVVAVVVSQVSKAGARGDLPRNGAVGIRLPATKAGDDAWEAGHAAAVPVARKVTLLTSAMAAVVIVLALFFEGAWVTALGVVPFVIVIVSLVPLALVANRAAREATAAGKAGGKKGGKKHGKKRAKKK